MMAQTKKITMDDLKFVGWKSKIIEQASATGVSPAKVAIKTGEYPKHGFPEFWPEPTLSTSADVELPDTIRLVEDKNLLSDLAWSISKAIQFPVNTIFAHGLGIVASAMSKSFKFEYGSNSKPVNLYVVTAQPPSTGKSGVNELLVEPVHEAFDAINRTAAVEQKKIKIRMASNKADRKNAKSKEQQFALEDEMTELQKQLSKHTLYTYALDDATPEATAKIALKQKGLFNIISAEADAINVILGSVYSDRKANYGIFLKGWDSERHHVARAGQEVMSGHVTGNIAVIAQDESIKTILAAGESGRGISERFLLVRENTFLGSRQFDKRVKVDDELLSKYGKMIFNIVREKGITLSFDDMSHDLINKFRRDVEPEMADNGKYSNNMMRGFIGKADKQIMKIACVLHAIENWKDKGSKSTVIDIGTTSTALNIFKNIAKAYISAADELGFTGIESEYQKVEEKIQSYANKGKMVITVNQLRTSIKDIKPFTGTPNLTNRLKTVIIPALEENNICVFHSGKLYVNPHIRD